MGAQLASQSADVEAHAKRDEVFVLIDALWLSTLQRISSRAAHEVKGALNAVAVNVEVVRSRAEKPGGELASVRPYAKAASDQLDGVIALAEGLLALARAARSPVDVANVVRQIAALLVPAARADGRRLDVVVDAELGVTSAGGNAVRLAIGAGLLAALEASANVRCVSAAGAGEPPAIRIETGDGATIGVDAAIVAAVVDAGIGMQAEPSAILLRFPR